MREKRKSKVIVAMSGGVDSSVAAALLKKEELDVIGVFMKFWSEPAKNELVGSWNKCCSPEAEKRARRVAKVLDIPFYIFDFRKEFKKKIVDYFLEEYKKGRTPNPCVVCNKEIKFGLFLEKALVLGGDFVATGHYARIKKGNNGIHLLRAKDKEKDQSYFLWQLSQKQLKHILFPVGDFTKAQVRNLAKKFKLPIPEGLPESQEVCFIENATDDFLKKYLKSKPGSIVDRKGKKLGRHQGLHFYTIGQRKGINLSGGPYYVLDKDSKKNLLIISKNEKNLYKKELTAKDINWILGKRPELPLKIKAKIRYCHQLAPASVSYDPKFKVYCLKFNRSQRAITPGQSVVFYQGGEVLGGGIIS